MDKVRYALEKIESLSHSDWEFFAARLTKVHLEKKAIVTKQGDTEDYLSFIEQGVVRLFIPNFENDCTVGFVFENEFVTAYDSFLTRLPSNYQIETLTPTVLWRISHEAMQTVYAQTEKGNCIGRKMAENMFLIKSKREQALLSSSAEERYLDLFQNRPQLFKEIPLKYIASYIGVTPQALSRIRKRIS